MSNNLIIIAVVAYLIGSIPFGYILVKLFLKQDIRQTGSGNIGATNVARSGKKGLAVATLLLDAGKGALAVVFAQHFDLCAIVTCAPSGYGAFHPTPLAASVAALAVIIGHIFPIWLLFKGGKGVATAIGAFAMLAPHAALSALACFVLVFAMTRYVSLSSVISAVAFPIFVYLFELELRSAEIIAMTAAASVVIILKHHGNIRRLIAGTEPKFGAKAIGTHDPVATERNI